MSTHPKGPMSMTPGEIFLTVFVAGLAGATVYLAVTVRELQQRMACLSYPPPDSEREAHEATKARTAELLSKRMALSKPESENQPEASEVALWPYEWATDPNLDPTSTLPTDGRHSA